MIASDNGSTVVELYTILSYSIRLSQYLKASTFQITMILEKNATFNLNASVLTAREIKSVIWDQDVENVPKELNGTVEVAGLITIKKKQVVCGNV